MNSLSRKIWLGIIAITALLTLLTLTARAQQTEHPLADVLARLESAETYTFDATSQQTLIPRATAANIGRTSEHLNAFVSGQITADQQAELALRVQGMGVNIPPMQLVQDGANLFVVEDGERVALDAAPTALTGMQNPAAFLYSAENITPLATDQTAQAFTFDIDGSKYASYLAQQANADAAANERVAPSPQLQNLTGTGEIWLDENGWIMRQILYLDIPKINEQYDLQSHTVVDFSFDGGNPHPSPSPAQRILREGEGAASSPPLAFGRGGWGVRVSPIEPIIVLSVMLFSVAIVRRKRTMQRAVPLTLAFVMLASPILQIIVLMPQSAEAASFEDALMSHVETAHAEAPAPVIETQAVALAPESGTVTDYDPDLMCGDGDDSTDSDLDTLNDFVELCLGTDPFNADTDFDNIADNLEVEGFLINGVRWYGNPLLPDSNSDGVWDSAEWSTPVGSAPSMDIDNDGIPNLWDNDNDGDNVPDEVDNSPQSFTAYQTVFEYESAEGQRDFDGYQYLELQLQPENSDHLHYGNSPLDWPDGDRKGTIVQYDNSSEDLSLVPYLRLTTYPLPEQEILDQYGVSYVQTALGDYNLHLPLSTVTDGGIPVAFATKLIFQPEILENVKLEDMELVWFVTVEVDTLEEDKNGDTEVVPEARVVDVFIDTYRISGLSVTLTDEVNVAWLGTPNMPNDDRDLFNLLFGLNEAFMGYQSPDWQTVVDRFGNAATPIEQTWGVAASDVAITSTTLAHVDELLGYTSNVLPTFLSDNGYPMNDVASLVMAMEQTVGLFNLDEFSSAQLASGTLEHNLTDIDLSLIRTLKLGGFEFDSGWQSLDTGAMLQQVMKRHQNVSAELSTLQATYPDLAAEDLQTTLYLLYSSWLQGHLSVIEINGLAIVPASADDAAITADLQLSAVDDLIIYLFESLGLAQEGAGYKLNTPAGRYDVVRHNESANLSPHTINGTDFTKSMFDGGLLNELAAAGYVVYGFVYASYGIHAAFQGLSTFMGILNFGKLAMNISVVITVALIGYVWYNYFTSIDNATNGYERDVMLGYALMYTFVTILLFALSISGIGILLVGLIYILQGILLGCCDIDLLNEVYSIVASVGDLTVLNDVTLEGVKLIVPGNRGIRDGGTLIIRDKFIGEMTAEKAEGKVDQQATSGDLYYYSFSYGFYLGEDTDDYTFSTDHGIEGENADTDRLHRSCHIHNNYVISGKGTDNEVRRDTQHCINTVEAEITFKRPSTAVDVRALFAIWVQRRQWVCQITSNCSGRVTSLQLPFDMAAEDRWDDMVFTVDVLPSTLQGIWEWDALFNVDKDGDGIIAITEQRRGSSDNNPDSDGDGLLDRLESQLRGRYGTILTDPDSDDDGLLDGQEYQLSLIIDDADSDDDLLSDGEEWPQIDAQAQTWSSGGWFVTINNQPYWVFTSPYSGDSDGDGLSDASEKANGTSPHAYNDAPRLELNSAETTASPTGSTAIYLGPDTTFTAQLDLFSTGAVAIADLLTLCFPAGLTPTNLTITSPSNPTQTIDGACYEWDFDADDLATGEAFNVAIAAETSTTSSKTDLIATLQHPIDGVASTISATIPIVVDADIPTVLMTDPTEDTLLGNGTTHYVIGGDSADATTWVEQVNVTLPSGTISATGTSPWAYTWELPADGVYNISAQAVDALGNLSLSDSRVITVDNTAPDVNVTLNSVATVAATASGAISVTMTGTASDNLSGLDWIQMSLNGQPWRTVWDADDYPLAANWTGEWRMANSVAAQGEHDVRVIAMDKANNVSPVFEGTILVDLQAPTAELTNRAFLADPPAVQSNTPQNLYGVANDAGRNPAPSTPAQLAGTLDSLGDATTLLQLSSLNDDDSGITLTWLGDVNGDRLADLAVGLPAAANGAGQVVIINGRGGNWPIPRLDESGYHAASDSIFTGVAGAGIGAYVAPAGDINGDGLSDFLIGDAISNRVYLIRGRVGDYGNELTLNGSIAYLQQTFLPPAGMTIGDAIAPAGDVNGDNIDDFLIGATGATTGYAYLILGDVATTAAIPVATAAAVVIETGSAGASLAGVGDVNDDRRDDFALGMGGQVYLFEGSAVYANGGLIGLDSADATHTFASADDQPTIVRFNDLDGDSVDDFGYTDGTTPQVVLGNSAATYTPQALNFAPAASGTMAAGGDVNRNGNADILVINSADDLYIIDGSNLGSIMATVENVRAVASAPYARGADLNADDASDIAVMPSAGAASRSTDSRITAINPAWLPQADPVLPQSETPAGRALNATVRVDDDYCDGCSNTFGTWGVTAFATIQDALDTISANSTIIVEPGQYAPITIATDDITIRGANADAVFIDGGGTGDAVVIDGADGVRLEKITIRNADRLLVLNDAGQFGWLESNDRNELSRVLLQDFNTHAVWMTDDSTLHTSDTTIVGAQDHIEIFNDGSATDAQTIQFLNDTRVAVGDYGGWATNDYSIFFAVDNGTNDVLYEYELEAGSWITRNFPAAYGGIVTDTVYAAQELSANLSRNRFMVLRPAGEGFNASIQGFNVGLGGWTSLDLGGWSDVVSTGAAMAAGDIHNHYIFSGNTNNKFWRFDSTPFGGFTLSDFTELTPPPATVGTGSSLLPYGAGLVGTYALIGNGSRTFCIWTATNFADLGTWDCGLAALPEAPQAGATLVSDGSNYDENTGFLYAVVGGGSDKWYRYDISADNWTTMPDLPININDGGGILRDEAYFYILGGGDSSEVWRYGRARANGFEKLTLNDVAVVTGDEAVSADWFNAADQPDHFTLSHSNLELIGGDSTTWTPTVGTVYSHTVAAFSNVQDGIYRLTSNGAVNAGYHDFFPNVIVSTVNTHFPTRFGSVQAAINSGANEIVVETGAFTEQFYMLSGVTLVGAGAELSSITMPASNLGTPLIGMEGVRGATIANLKLIGDGSVTGIDADGQLRDALLTRSIVQNFGTGVAISDLNSQLTLVNNTILDNGTGVAATNCGSVNARNNVIAYNQTLGLSYEACAATKLHTYNLYWANGSDLSPNSPGSAELFLNPLYTNLAAGDFSTAAFSPIINGGDPADPAPAGSGGRVDIGHLEQNGASFYVDDDYCQTCNNDGLLWQVNAFDEIQDAIDAVEAIQTSLTTGVVVPFSIGVGPGVYDEIVTIRSPITLIGSGADQTILRSPSSSGVIFDGATHAGIEQFKIDGTNAANFSQGVLVTGSSNNITIQRNLLTKWDKAGEAIVFEDRGSGLVKFNTIVDAGVGVQANDPWAYVTAHSNIIDDTFAAFEANGDPIRGIIVSDYNLLYDASWAYYLRVNPGANDILGQAPQYVDTTHYMIEATSPALDSADPAEDVPLGGGLIADIGWREYEDQTIALSILMGELDASRVTANIGVQGVEYAVVQVADSSSPVTATLPSTWSNATLSLPNQSLTYWNATYTPTTEGYYRIYSRATDSKGNVEDDASDWYDGAFVVDDSDPVVTWLSPADSSSFGTGFVTLQAEVADYIGTEFNIDTIAFEINGTQYPATWSNEEWSADGSSPRTFFLYTDVISTGLPVGSYIAKAVVVDEAGNSAETTPISFDVTGVGTADTITPTLTITSHVDGGIVDEYETVIAGTGSDAESSIQHYGISFDGGISWVDATNTGSGFSYMWLVGAEQGTTYPVRVRAIDRAGNVTVRALSLSVDTVPPSDLAPFTFSVPPGSHTDEPILMTASWITPTDSSGTSQIYVRRGSTPEAVANPSLPISGNSYGFNFYPEADNIFYIGIAVEDLSQNRLHYTFGPWHIGSLKGHGISWNDGVQTIQFDGNIDLANSEWLTPTEQLDVDAGNALGEQTLYATWDGSQSYIAWEGVDWATAGTLWAYYDLSAGVGSTEPISLTGKLPFSADYAVSFDGTIQVDWEFDGTNWVVNGTDDEGYSWAHDAQSLEMSSWLLGQLTENYDQHRMVAFGLNDNDDVWATFPLLNGNDSTFDFYYDWNISTGTDLLNLPIGARLPQAELSVSSTPSAQTQLSTSNLISYQASVGNMGSTTMDGAQLSVSSTTGLTYIGVTGATCASCGGSEWLLDLPSIAADATQAVVITAVTAADLTAIDAVTTTVTLSSSIPIAQAHIAHTIDTSPPTGTFDQTPGNVLNAMNPTVSGSADDGDGAGVALVEVSTDGNNWQAAQGTTDWTATLPNSRALNTTVNVQVRVTDHLDQSAIFAQDFVLDSTSPTTTVSSPAFLGKGRKVSGVATDPAPADAQVKLVRIQLDSSTNVWQSAALGAPNLSDERAWAFSNFGGGDGVARLWRVQITDYADNVTVTDWYMATVDSIAPVIAVTNHHRYVAQNDPSPALTGTVSDGSGIAEMRVLIEPAVGASSEMTLTVSNGAWTAMLDTQPLGTYTLTVTAEDVAGNVRMVGSYVVEVVETVPTAVQVQSVSIAPAPISWMLFAVVVGLLSLCLWKRRLS